MQKHKRTDFAVAAPTLAGPARAGGANRAGTPAGILTDSGDAEAFFMANTQDSCTPQNFNCNQQKATAAVLDDYNNGVYLGGPPHCGG